MSDSLKAEVKVLETEAGKPIVILNERDASRRSIFLNDRIKITHGDRETIAIVDLTKNIPEGDIALFEEAQKELEVEQGDEVEVEVAMKPESINYIKKRIKGHSLEENEIQSIIQDTVNYALTDPELMAYTVAVEMSDFSMREAEHLTRAMIETGKSIDVKNALDKHCIGGVPGNRTTPIIVSIIAAAGHKIPKTSSRAITSPAGTADMMEVLTNVEFSASEIEEIVGKINGCITWGGAVNLAPADDEFIRVRKSLSLDPMEQVLASVLAKKKSVGSDTVLIDIPIGEEAKIEEKGEANKLSKYFKRLGKKLDMNVVTMISDGSHPIGNGLGPALEAIDVLKVLKSGGKKGPQDLKDKAVKMADILLKEVNSEKRAEEILENGQAYEKMKEIIETQGGEVIEPEDIQTGENKITIEAEKRGRVNKIHNHAVSKVAKTAGCPRGKKSGVYLHKQLDDPVDEGEDLITIYSKSEKRLERALEEFENSTVFEFKSLLRR